MSRVLKFIFLIGFLLFGGGFLFALFQFASYNGFGEWFDFAKPDSYETIVEERPNEDCRVIWYTYSVDGKSYSSYQNVGLNVIDLYEFHEDNLVYNKQLPFFSMIGKKEFKLRNAKAGMVVTGILFLFIFSIYKFADLEKWIGVYTRGEYKSGRG